MGSADRLVPDAGPASLARLIGRDDLQAALSTALAEARSGRGHCVLVSGEPGIGKSALLDWLARAASGWLVLRAACWEGGGVAPLWPWRQVLRSVGSAADLPAVPDACDEPVNGVPKGTQLDREARDARFQIFDRIGHQLTDLSRTAPVLVLLDDLQWADDTSVHLLRFLQAAVAGRPVLVVGAYRDTEASTALLEAADRAEVVVLGGLDLAGVSAMIAAMPGEPPGDDVVRDAWLRSGGNPFFVRELTRLVQAQTTPSTPGRLPSTVVETVRRRLARLPEACVRVLDWAALDGVKIDVDLLVAAGAGDNARDLTTLLDRAVAAGIVAPGPPYRFGHDLYREALLVVQPAGAADRHLALARALSASGGPAVGARVAAHLARAGPTHRSEAAATYVDAARRAMADAGFAESSRLYGRAVDLLPVDSSERGDLVLAAAWADNLAGNPGQAAQRYREVVRVARATGDPTQLGRAALGWHGLGHRSAGGNPAVLAALRDADHLLQTTDLDAALHSRVVGGLSRELRHGSALVADAEIAATAERAVRLARRAGDPAVMAAAQLALHDARWRPGSAAVRLPIVEAMLTSAEKADDADLLAQAQLLRATALLELGDPAGRDALAEFVRLVDDLGHPRGRWSALTRRATLAEIAGRITEAARLSDEAFDLGRQIGEPDAVGCYATLRGSLMALGASLPGGLAALPDDDPLVPFLPMLQAWPLVVAGDLTRAGSTLGDFSVLDVPITTGLEGPAIAAVVFAAIGTHEQRQWAYHLLLPYAGTHVVVAGCAAYHGAVDYHLGTLAGALGDEDRAHAHFVAALEQHRRVGAAGWVRLSAAALEELAPSTSDQGDDRNAWVRRDGLWWITFDGKQIRLPDAKGLSDLLMLIKARGVDVHVFDLLGLDPAVMSRVGADPTLDETARANYRIRIERLGSLIDEADLRGDPAASATWIAERDALVTELAAATGLGGRRRRLGDDQERARKTVGARIRDSLRRIEAADPILGSHLRAAVRLGVRCSYRPAEPTVWRLA